MLELTRRLLPGINRAASRRVRRWARRRQGADGPVTRLDVIFRQAQTSHIISNAHRINRGESPDTSNTSSDFFVFVEENPERAAELLVFVSHHPLADKWTAQRAQGTLADLSPNLPPEAWNAAQERARSATLDAVVRLVLDAARLPRVA